MLLVFAGKFTRLERGVALTKGADGVDHWTKFTRFRSSEMPIVPEEPPTLPTIPLEDAECDPLIWLISALVFVGFAKSVQLAYLALKRRMRVEYQSINHLP